MADVQGGGREQKHGGTSAVLAGGVPWPSGGRGAHRAGPAQQTERASAHWFYPE